MKIAYFDCPTGIAGNMILGALLDAGLDKDYLLAELKKLRMANYELRIRKIKKNGITGTYVYVKTRKTNAPRNLCDILKIITNSRLEPKVKKLSIKIFKKIAAAEARVHSLPIDKIHFHEVGAADSIIDIVGSTIGIAKLNFDRIYSSPLNVGKPAPATVELLKGVAIYNNEIKRELVTPTGAAIITSIAESFQEMPRLKTKSVGYGAGRYNLKVPNLLRLIIGEAEEQYAEDAVLQIETNIDDMNPELYDQAIARIMKVGALDAYITPIRMKKKRSAVNLTALTSLENKDKVLEAIFSETTTLGVRIYLVKRKKLSREIKKFRNIRFKIGRLGEEIKTISPEYEDLKKAVKKYKLPLETVYQEAIRRVNR